MRDIPRSEGATRRGSRPGLALGIVFSLVGCSVLFRHIAAQVLRTGLLRFLFEDPIETLSVIGLLWIFIRVGVDYAIDFLRPSRRDGTLA